MMKIGRSFLFVSLTVLVLVASASSQNTAFSYQGQLTDGGNPANGSFQMQFKLFDSLAGPTQIGSTISNAAVTVTNGVFSTKLDFGTGAFAGAGRWLEIAVRRNSGESYVTLSPREQVASSPYAIRTLSAAMADDSQRLGGIASSEYVTNSTVGSSFIRNGTSLQTGNFNISGNGSIGGLVGLGTAVNGNFRLDSFGSVRAFSATSTHFVAETTGGTNAWARFYMRTPNRSWFMGTSQNFNGNELHLVDETAGQTRMAIATNGNVSIGGGPPSTRLAVSGGVPWSSNGWTASMNLQNASALGWEANASGQRFGIGQSGGGLYFFRTTSAFGTSGTPANYDLSITDTGNIAQPSGGYGLPKAMVFVLANGTISRCYNGITGATTDGCGFSASTSQTGFYTVSFGFDVTQRFLSLTTYGNTASITGRITSTGVGGTNVGVYTFQTHVSGGGAQIPSDFFLYVY